MGFEEDVVRAAHAVRQGGIVVYPTDTVWGVGCDATNADAVAKVYALKCRDDSKALITLMTPEMLEVYLPHLTEECRHELDYDSRPTTVICSSVIGLASNLIAEDGSVGVRLSREAYSEALVREAGVPVVSTSVNISGCHAPVVFDEIDSALLCAVDYVAEYRRTDPTRVAPSRIVAFDAAGKKIIIRP